MMLCACVHGACRADVVHKLVALAKVSQNGRLFPLATLFHVHAHHHNALLLRKLCSGLYMARQQVYRAEAYQAQVQEGDCRPGRRLSHAADRG